MDLNLSSSVQYIPGVGPVMAQRIAKLGIETVHDLLFYAPFRYDDYSLVSNIKDIQPGEVVTIRGTIDWHKTVLTRKGKKMQQAMVNDGTSSAMVIWFNQPFLTQVLHKGVEVRLAGEVSWFGRRIALISPSYEIIAGASSPQASLHTGRLVPVYSETEGLSSKWLRSRIAYALEHFLPQVEDPLPESIRTKNNLRDLREALQHIHFPESKADAQSARSRLAFEELFFTQLASLETRYEWITSARAHPLAIQGEDINRFHKSLPFTLTMDQEKAVSEIAEDLGRSYPANRLLEGDVGSGKTVVAAAAMYLAHKNNLRSVLMAPTEILASQHFATLSKILAPHGISVGLVTRTHKDAGAMLSTVTQSHVKQEIMFASGNQIHHVIVGTHALLSNTVNHSDVGLIVIDEQQRFGVRQRALLRDMAKSAYTPHLLTMTATPIPRTIALTVFGNLDLSVLNQMPSGRKKVKTWVAGNDKRDNAYDWIIRHVRKENGQVFILCPLIEESESLGSVKAANAEYKRLKTGVLKSLKVGLLHGRMAPAEKQDILQKFRDRKIEVLVSTPVVEVGIDIPGATVMMIEASERFGLGQLHQLRGRVGRNDREAYCFLFTENDDERVLTRLKALETIYSGPQLAQLDLELRGPGEVFGIRQHGLPTFRFADFADTALIARTRESAKILLTEDPGLLHHPLLREKVRQATIGESSQD